MRNGRACGAIRTWAVLSLMLLLARPAAACVGDCDGDAHVGVDELVTSIHIGLGIAQIGACQAADNNRDGTVTVDELVLSTSKAIDGCGGGPATQRLFSPQDNELRRYDLATGEADVFIPAARG